MSDELSKNYDPRVFEDKIYQKWLNNDVFIPNEGLGLRFSMVAPPPNVTGILHMGHALNFTLQDIFVRYQRMRGASTLWLFGTDHAGIATQAVFEKHLKKLGKSKDDFSREEFVEEIFKLKDKHREIIVNQVERLGASYDHSRERFTLDAGLCRAVNKVFIDLYNKGLIYKGEYLVNLDPGSGSVVSDEEVEYREVIGKIYFIKYLLNDGSFIEVATTRPETMFGDVAVAVNPNDNRYKSLIGRDIIVPIANRKVKIIADSHVDMEFGSGALKITPAHDPNDFEIAKRHNLAMINILTKKAKLNENVPIEYQGLSVSVARNKIERDLKDKGFLIDVKSHKHQVGHCHRSGEIIEPYLSTQWFVKMKPLADAALKALMDGEIRFYPKKWENTYKHWLLNIKDWCISRQLVWGHSIPAWYDIKTGEIIVSESDPSLNEEYKDRSFVRDPDVLDTWFSSWLWPFSSLGWPELTLDFENYYPTNALITAYDIIFFWVARMVMAGLEFTGQVPFKDIYITPLLRDKKGRKMSKSLGNGIDPLEIIDQYGSDALRFTLAFLSVQGQDLNIDTKDFMFGARFLNKVFNASKFILSNLEGRVILDNLEFDSIDKWLLTSLNSTVAFLDWAFKNYKYNEAAKAVYEFFWNNFCDWYIEISKINLGSNDIDLQNMTISKLIFFLKESLIIMHPFIPFITEEIYSKFMPLKDVLALAKYPEFVSQRDFKEEFQQFNLFKEFIISIRTLRSEFSIVPNIKINVALRFGDTFEYEKYFKDHEHIAKKLINFDCIFYNERYSDMIGVPSVCFESFADIKSLIDTNKELARLNKQLEKYERLKHLTLLKLQNQNFLSNAPVEIIDLEKSKLEEFDSFILKINIYIDNLRR
ncbi:valine--tRNA ligase [Borrelia anserina]|uniref:Valine--tRNA ligase n=2 Tax=Borrelia anserina TaxID=143 RepID=W5SP52_BORAN|nr:valine--tRNA ligase [Borrelia anserina]AHH08707.1 Valyl-tRNA synthetase [Borrelia anserina BA2]APR65161.1 valine--tRNA ligase [Borrelia anserina Es]UPA07085.1 valine--tRNA ligase [Borrelia anserina]